MPKTCGRLCSEAPALSSENSCISPTLGKDTTSEVAEKTPVRAGFGKGTISIVR